MPKPDEDEQEIQTAIKALIASGFEVNLAFYRGTECYRLYWDKRSAHWHAGAESLDLLGTKVLKWLVARELGNGEEEKHAIRVSQKFRG